MEREREANEDKGKDRQKETEEGDKQKGRGSKGLRLMRKKTNQETEKKEIDRAKTEGQQEEIDRKG